MNSVLQIPRVTLWERFSIDCKGLSCNQFVFLCQLKTKRNFQFSFLQFDPVSMFLLPLGRILLSMRQTAFFYRDRRRLQTIREKCVLLICDTFGVFWFLSLEYVIFYCFSIGFRISSQLKRVQFHF